MAAGSGRHCRGWQMKCPHCGEDAQWLFPSDLCARCELKRKQLVADRPRIEFYPRRSYMPDALEASGNVPGERSAKASAKVPKPQRRQRRKRGTASKLIIETIAQLADNQQWGKTDRQLQKMMGMAPATFYDAIGKDSVLQRALHRYHEHDHLQ